MNWTPTTLGALISLEYGYALPTRERDGSGAVPVIGSNGICGYHLESRVSGPGIVVGRKGSAGLVNWIDDDFWPIDTTYYVVPKTEVKLKWIYYLLLHLRLDNYKTSTGVPGLNRNDVHPIPVLLPPPSEQNHIVEILDQADRLRKLHAEADRKAERILPALFIKMFGDPIRNPKGWSVEILGKLGDLDRGKSRHRPRNDPRLLGGPYPFIQTGDVANSGGYIRSYISTYSEFGLAQSRLWPAGTLCITIAANIAATGILGFDACFPDSIVGFTPGPRTNSAYVRVLLEFLKPMLERSAPQMAQKNINLEILRNLSVPVPDIKLQKEFLQHHDEIMRINLARRDSDEKIERTWQTLIHRAFRGELTAKWRESHVKELLFEMEHQTRALHG